MKLKLADLKALAIEKLSELYATARVPISRRSEFKRDVSLAVEEVRCAVEPADVVYALFKLAAKYGFLKREAESFLKALSDLAE